MKLQINSSIDKVARRLAREALRQAKDNRKRLEALERDLIDSQLAKIQHHAASKAYVATSRITREEVMRNLHDISDEA